MKFYAVSLPQRLDEAGNVDDQKKYEKIKLSRIMYNIELRPL